MFEEKIIDDQEKTIVMPLLPLRDVVVFPHMIVPFLWAAKNRLPRWNRQ